MHVARLSSLLINEGYEVTAMVDPDSPLAQRLKQESVPLYPIKEGGYIRPLTAARVHSFFIGNRVDIVHVHYSRDLWWVVPALRGKPNVPVILTKHVGTLMKKKDKFHQHLYERVQRIIAISEVIRQNIIDTHPVPPEKVVTVHHGIDVDRFDPRRYCKASSKEKMGFQKDDFLIGLVGRLQFAKGYGEFLHMAAKLKPEFPRCRFVMIGEATHGEPEEAERILHLVETLNLQDVVVWLGYQEDIPAVLSALDLFVFPSHAEAFGMALIEAMAMGLPVVASNCDGVLDIIEHQHSGILVPAKDAQQLSAAVADLIRQPELRHKIAVNALERARSYFNQTRMLKNIKDIYAKALLELN